jgi:serine/threonine-protein kinase
MTSENIGHYRIIAAIGAGGMGEVYRARDTKLGRDVAIKVLPPAFAADVGRMSRFEREARVLASLNHPNIAQIYGVEERALVMEFVNGESPKGPMPFEDTWKIAMQIADALEYAHDKGVIHRDLKPANVKVTPEGVVKLLDFGLAKAYSQQPENASGDPEVSPTVTLGATVAGTIMGTAAYMSPEQARGKLVDKRADIWAWGVVLYELLTGERLFQGEDTAETLAAVIHKQPVLEKAPPQLRTLLLRCLEKDPKKRLRDISVAKELLDQKPQTEARATSKLPWMVSAGMLLATSAALGFGWWRATRPVAHPLMRLDVDLGSGITLPTPNGSGTELALSPDGTRLVYLGSIGNGPPRLFLRRLERLDQPNATELPGTEGAGGGFFSPDGQWIGFAAFPGKRISKISVEGGAVVPLASFLNYAGATWSEDGTIVVSEPLGRGLFRIPAGEGPETVLVAPDKEKGELALAWPQILPGGRALLFSHVGPEGIRLDVYTVADQHRKTVARGTARGYYLAVSDHDGYLVYNNQSTLFAAPFDRDKLETRGPAVPVLNDLAYDFQFGPGEFAYSASGTLVYRKGGVVGESQTTVQWVDATGKRQPLLSKPGGYRYLMLSPDGRRLALVEGRPSDIWVYDPQRGSSTRLTFGGDFVNQWPVWSPDGRYVVFASRPRGLFWARADGAGQPRLLLRDDHEVGPFSFTPDGKWLAYYKQDPLPQIWTVPVQEDGAGLKAGTPEQFLKDRFANTVPLFSPDGHWLAYESDASEGFEVYVRPFPPPASGQGKQEQVSNGGSPGPFHMAWSPSGHEFYYQSGDQIMAVSYSVKGDRFIPERPRVWISKVGGREWAVAPDGKRVAVITPVGSTEAPQQDHTVVFLLNFLDYLKQKVPLNK